MKRTMSTISHAGLLLLIMTMHALGETAQPAKIYLIGSTLIRSTPASDIRFYNIANPSRPVPGARIVMPGNHDVAVVENYLYADNNNDLVIFNVTNRAKPVAVDTIRGVFNIYPTYGLVRDWAVDDASGLRMERSLGASDRGARTGTGGSPARFAVVGNYLYCIDFNSLKVFDITDPWRPQYRNTVSVGASIETLFPDKDNLFIGGRFGMYIFDATNPEVPVWRSQFTHIRSCDPVVVEGERAYVTLSGGRPCGGAQNERDILDIANLNAPRLLRTVAMSGPYGLAVRGDVVVVCDGESGIMVMSTADPANPVTIGYVRGIVPYDIILDGDLMVVTAKDGLLLYDAHDLARPRLYGRLEA